MKFIIIASITLISIQFQNCNSGKSISNNNTSSMSNAENKPIKSNEELKKQLTDDQYEVTQNCGTEPAFNNAYWNNHKDGMYHCVVCGEPLFSSTAKFDSGTGWPSFDRPFDSLTIKEKIDNSYGTKRTEVVCQHCGAHLGHLFNDGPATTGMRYCINSAALKFDEKKK